MADSWLSYEEYTAYGYRPVEAGDFPQAAAQAALLILERTHWRAAIAKDAKSLQALQDCEALLISDAAARAQAAEGSANGTVTSSSNDGYSESYASAADLRREATLQDAQTIARVLGGPATGWMLYEGGIYHPPARH